MLGEFIMKTLSQEPQVATDYGKTIPDKKQFTGRAIRTGVAKNREEGSPFGPGLSALI